MAIIGGGFSGATLAAQLLRSDRNLNIVVIERFHLPGRGVAYGTQFGLHLLLNGFGQGFHHAPREACLTSNWEMTPLT